MKIIAILLLLIISNEVYSQKQLWQDFSKENVITLNINKTKSYKIDKYIFNVVWNKKLSYSENISDYGGIQKLSILKENRELQTINNIEDNVALGNILFSFYDYNFDGHIDFSIPIDCGQSCWEKYYLFNPKSNKFEHIKSWDYLRIQKIDKKNKMILSQPDGNAIEDNRVSYRVKGLEIIEVR